MHVYLDTTSIIIRAVRPEGRYIYAIKELGEHYMKFCKENTATRNRRKSGSAIPRCSAFTRSQDAEKRNRGKRGESESMTDRRIDNQAKVRKRKT